MPVAEFDGVQIHYKERGDGPPCLGIMGWGLDQRYWAGQIPAVTETHRFITFDNRGTGRSSPEPAATIEEMAADAVALLDHLGIEQTVVFGVSMGGAVAQRVVLDYPERVGALILALTFARVPEFMRRQADLGHGLAAQGLQAIVDATLVRLFTPMFFEVGNDVIDRLVRSYLDAPGGPGMAAEATLRGQLDAIQKHDTLADLGSVSVPTLVLGAKMDMMVPYFCSEEIAAAIPGAHFVSFETGHACFIEEMDAVNEAIHGFLERVASGWLGNAAVPKKVL